MLVVSREALRSLSEAAFGDINHYLRPGHLKQLRSILEDKEASDNDKFVAFDFLKNANIAAGGVLPMCQDTGTAIIMGKKGARVLTDGDDEAALSEGARDAYLRRNLRYSQVAPLSMYEEKNTANNMPAQCEIYAEGDDSYKFMFMAKGGGNANKSFLFQATPSVLTRDRMLAFLKEKVLTLGTAACPPYHLANRDRRHLGRALHENRKTCFGALPRCAAHPWLGRWQCLPRSRDGAGDFENDAVARRWRAVRRQIFLS
jgi:fumarate hydratase class I